MVGVHLASGQQKRIMSINKMHLKIGYGTYETATELIPRAFSPRNGMLKHPAVISPAEAKGIFYLMTGGFL